MRKPLTLETERGPTRSEGTLKLRAIRMVPRRVGKKRYVYRGRVYKRDHRGCWRFVGMERRGIFGKRR